MQYALTPEQMKAADSTAINEFGIPSLVLMENAARDAAQFITKILLSNEEKVSNILIFCGSGNNGGDGFAVARHLYDRFNVRIIRIGDHLKMSPETYINFQAAERIGISITHIQHEDQIDKTNFNADCIIDSLIGVGGSENIKGLALNILKKVKDSRSLKIAIDTPTGLNTETGSASPYCFEADYTVTMFAKKTGMLLNEGIEKCGVVHIAYLGAPQRIISNKATTRILEKEDLINIIPKRKRVSSKFDYGRVLVIAGSKSFPGAAALCANAAITTGAGLVQLLTTKIHPAVLPDIIFQEVPATVDGTISMKSYDFIKAATDKANSVLIGPGLGDNAETKELVRKLINELPDEKTIILDADGLRSVSNQSQLRKNVILTPHTGEFSRMTGIDRLEIEKSAPFLAGLTAKSMNCVIHLKYIPSITTNGKISYWNIAGNPGMAKGGSGDVLSGIIAALAARGVEPTKAAAAGAFIHASAGDLFVSKFSSETLTASKLIDLLPEVVP